MSLRTTMPYYANGQKIILKNAETKKNKRVSLNFSDNSVRENNVIYDKKGTTFPRNYNNVSFGYAERTHKALGARIVKKADGTYQSIFRVWAPYAKKIQLEVRDAAAKLVSTVAGISEESRLWNINTPTPDDGKTTVLNPAKIKGNNIFEFVLPLATLPAAGLMYRYAVTHTDAEGNETAPTYLKDPVSNAQDHIFSWSRVYNHNNYEWHDQNWMSGNDTRRVSALAQQSHEYLKKGTGAGFADI
jgi:1,4-alpha-glucan branching enzyme